MILNGSPPAALARKIAKDATWFLLVAAGFGVAAMIAYTPKATTPHFAWQPEKLAYSLLGGCIASILVGSIRLYMWRRADPEALD